MIMKKDYSISRIYLLVGLFGLVCFGIHAQTGIAIEDSKHSLSVGALNEIGSDYFTKVNAFVAESGSLMRVDIYLDQRGVRTLEGIDIRSTGEAKCRFRATNQLTEKEATFTISIPITGSSASGTVETKVLRHLANQTTWHDSLTSILTQIIPAGVDCNELAAHLLNKSEEDWHACLVRMIRFKNTFRSCAEHSSLLVQAELNKIDEKLCTDVLYEATLLYDSGTNQNINRAVQKLLQLPPSSPCREKALGLSGTYAKNHRLTKQNRTRLSHYQDVMRISDTEAWLAMQLEN